jgi:murein DD-endopeptidase MepM/ murein hydrolase activator NlpD
MNLPMRNTAILILLIGILLSACSNNIWGTYDQYLTPTIKTSVATPVDPIFTLTPTASATATLHTLTATKIVPPGITPTQTNSITPGTSMPGSIIPYISQSGDSLKVVAIHFGISISEITSSVSLPATGFINPGTLLFLPSNSSDTPTSPAQRILPDSELVDSPTAVDFDIESYVKKAGGKLSTFTDFHTPVGTLSGVDSIKMISIGSSINPRLLLALIQQYTGWVQGESIPGLNERYLFGYNNPAYNAAAPTLYQPMRLVIQDLLTGYYSWRTGNLSELTFPDGTKLHIAPDLNAGSVALQYFFSKHLNYSDWQQAINPDNGFPALYKSMFGDPWDRDKPLFPPNLIQPTFTLPFVIGAPWNFTYGPHPAWEAESTLGALDFAPSGVSGCGVSNAWVVAISSGQIVRSESSYVVLDQNPDGLEQTGWVVIYQHISSKDRIPTGTFVEAGTHIGHPSCEGGTANGTHIHIARKYNGEWVAADGPLPFVLSGWTAHAGSQPGEGTLTKDDKVIIASPVSEGFSKIIRQPGE